MKSLFGETRGKYKQTGEAIECNKEGKGTIVLVHEGIFKDKIIKTTLDKVQFKCNDKIETIYFSEKDGIVTVEGPTSMMKAEKMLTGIRLES